MKIHQTLLPEKPRVRYVSGKELYSYDGKSYPPQRNTGPAPECRVEISPFGPAAVDYFLHVLTATDASAGNVPVAKMRRTGAVIQVTVDHASIEFTTERVGGNITVAGRRCPFPDKIVPLK